MTGVKDMQKLVFASKAEEDTLQLGEKIGENVAAGQVILLEGKLGSGKTRLVKGLARGLDIDEEITSPTYKLINEYQGRLSLFHMDLYRLEEGEQLLDIGFVDYIYRSGVVAVEWPALARDFLPDGFLEIRFVLQGTRERKINMQARGKLSHKLLSDLNSALELESKE